MATSKAGALAAGLRGACLATGNLGRDLAAGLNGAALATGRLGLLKPLAAGKGKPGLPPAPLTAGS